MTSGTGPFLTPQCRGSQDDTTNIYQGSRPKVLRQEDFLCFSYISLCKTCDPHSRVTFCPNDVELNTKIILLFANLSLLNSNQNQGSEPYTYFFQKISGGKKYGMKKVKNKAYHHNI